jgi:YesN/AraC family two-component response regulator
MMENNTIPPPGENIPEGSTWFNKVNDYILMNLREDLSAYMILQQFSFNLSTLERIFKKHTGQPYKQYVERVRMEKARNLLVKERCMVKEAMYATGYKNRGTFRNAFKKIYGVPPIRFKRQYA